MTAGDFKMAKKSDKEKKETDEKKKDSKEPVDSRARYEASRGM